MPQATYPLPFAPVSPRQIGIDQLVPGEVTVRTSGSDELAKELVRSRAVEAVASTIAGMDGAMKSGFEFGLVIKW